MPVLLKGFMWTPQLGVGFMLFFHAKGALSAPSIPYYLRAQMSMLAYKYFPEVEHQCKVEKVVH